MESIILTPEVFIVDWDGVIQSIEKYWLIGISQKPEIFKSYFDFSKLNFSNKGFMNEVMGRKTYYINNWLLKNSNQNLPKSVYNEFMKIYDDDPLFYEVCPFLLFAGVLKNIAKQKFTQEIVFLTHVSSEDGIDKRKDIMFNRYFASESKKFKLATIPTTKSKWEWINENRPNYTTVVDDRFDILLDIINKTKSDKKCFLMPIYGYNEDGPKNKAFLNLIEKKNIEFSTYANSFIEGWGMNAIRTNRKVG